VDNLLANIRSHAPPGTPAQVQVRVTDGRAELRVSDCPSSGLGDAASVASS
jgi:hypothetical protein